MADEGEPAEPVGAAATSDPAELLDVQAHVQRYLAARSTLEACETDLVRVTAAALASGLSTEHVCDRLADLQVDAELLPQGLRTTLGYSGPP